MTIHEIKVEPDIHVFHKGTFDLTAVYQTTIAWMNKHQVEFVWEDLYKQKESIPDVWDTEIRLSGEVKFDEFIMWKMNFFYRINDMVYLDEIGPSGDRLVKGRLEAYLGSSVVTDYQEAYTSESFIVSSLRKMMAKIWSRGNPGQIMSQTTDKLQELAGDIRIICKVEVTK